MTIKDVANQLYGLAVDGEFDYEKRTKSWLLSWLEDHFKYDFDKRAYLLIALPDGKWLCQVSRYDKHGYDYYIPDDRESERRLWDYFVEKG